MDNRARIDDAGRSPHHPEVGTVLDPVLRRQEGRPAFATSALATLKKFAAEGPAGNRWFKVNLHVHGEGSDPAEVVRCAGEAKLDLIAVTDHQSFRYFDPIAAAARNHGRPLTVLPGIEITTLEGVHVLAIFPVEQTATERTELKGWLDFHGDGDTRQASRKRLEEILTRVDELGGVVVVPHPFTEGIGMLDGARKMSTKTDWLETGHVRLIQIPEDRVKYLDRDQDGAWLNRYVLSSARAEDIRSSYYCLAPFNRTDAKRPGEIGNGCSWFWMSEPSVEGLKQVACEPRTRISRIEPSGRTHPCVLGLAVTGGYFDDESFEFSDGLTCIIGQNYAGKSAVLDFIRFALGQETQIRNGEDRHRFISRLNGILQPDSSVEIYLRAGEKLYLVRRTFQPTTEGVGPRQHFVACEGAPNVYLYDPEAEQLDPVEDFDFPLEVYEQGRIGRLRDDVSRQLEMLDEFAGVEPLKAERLGVLENLNRSAARLAPLYQERERVAAQVGGLAVLERELSEKEQLLPGDDEKKWGTSQQLANGLDAVVVSLRDMADRLEALPAGDMGEESSDLGVLFGRDAPSMPLADQMVHDAILAPWRNVLTKTLTELQALRRSAVSKIRALVDASTTQRAAWRQLYTAHERETTASLAKAGVESPRELLRRVQALRAEVNSIKTKSRPRLAEVRGIIDREETARAELLRKLRTLNIDITARRQERASALTRELNDQIRIVLHPSADDSSYRQVLEELTAQQRLRTEQLPLVTGRLSPLDLAETCIRSGKTSEGADAPNLRQACGVTEHSQNVLCRIADEIEKLNRLQTTLVQDVPEILVKRRGEDNYASLRTELSPGEQSAALLMLALQTHSLPLILDQPEDELGYDYVVHLVVPALLYAKSARQVLVVTHNANIAVLGDADHVCKLENHPAGEGSRHCAARTSGAFENPAITNALLDLEGGQRAFQFRLHRYALPRTSKADTLQLLKPEQLTTASAAPVPLQKY